MLHSLSFEAEASGLEIFLEAVCWVKQKPCGYHMNDRMNFYEMSPRWLEVTLG